MFGLFFFFFFLSYYSSRYLLEHDSEKTQEFLSQLESQPVIQEFKAMLNDGRYFEIFVLIFVHNLQIALVNYFFGIGFLLSIIIQASNGFLIGFILGVSSEIFSNFIYLIGFLLVMILEVVAITSTAVEGMYLTYTFLRPEKMWKTKLKAKAMKKTLSQSIKIIALCILLLLLAAFIETLLIYHQASVNIKPLFIGV